jgi:hypothetical protein
LYSVDIDEAALIDWHDFVLVETIDFGDTKPEVAEVQQVKVELDSQEMEIEDINTAPVFKRHKPDDDIDPEIKDKIKEDYKPEVKKTAKMQKCPRCDKLIPENEYELHLKKEFMSKSKDTNKNVEMPFVSNEEMNENIQQFAEKRTDLFGTSKDDARVDNSAEGPKVIYDGHVAGMTRTTANAAMLAQQQKKNIDIAVKSRDNFKHKVTEQTVEAPAFKPLLNIKQSIQFIRSAAVQGITKAANLCCSNYKSTWILKAWDATSFSKWRAVNYGQISC